MRVYPGLDVKLLKGVRRVSKERARHLPTSHGVGIDGISEQANSRSRSCRQRKLNRDLPPISDTPGRYASEMPSWNQVLSWVRSDILRQSCWLKTLLVTEPCATCFGGEALSELWGCSSTGGVAEEPGCFGHCEAEGAGGWLIGTVLALVVGRVDWLSFWR